jgi:hypothetical protein
MKSTYKTALILILLLLNSWIGTAQIEFKTEFNLKAMVSAKERSPFWMHTNQRGRLTDSTNLAGWVSMKGTYDLSEKSTIEIGGGLLCQDVNNKFKLNIDELYGQFRNSWLQIIGGRKQHEELYDGLSATNGNILWSLNARPILGLQLSTIEPIYFLFDKKLGFSGSWNEFHMYKNRYVENTLLHNKSLYLHYSNNEDLKIKLGIQHYVQWGGTSPNPGVGKQPSDITDYIRVISGHDGGEDSLEREQDNALGNHLGSYDLIISKEFKTVDLKFVYNHLFEDGSGMLMYNLFDAYYGLYAKFKNRARWDDSVRLVESMMYEFYFTNGNYTSSKAWVETWDNYFHNNVYRSGWTYNNNVIGLPFFSTNFDGKVDKSRVIDNSRFAVHHLGFQGHISNFLPYKTLLSYRKNYGINPENKISTNVFSTLFDINLLQHPFSLNVQTAVDFTKGDVNLGAGIKLNKQF